MEEPSDPLEAFRRAVMADPVLQARLGEIVDPGLFAADAVRAASERGIALTVEAAHARPAPMRLDRWPGPGWLPARSVAEGGAPDIEWAWFGAPRLVEPFFADSVGTVVHRPMNRVIRARTGLNALVADAAAHDSLMPQGLIFHMSRCGSTLAAQALAAVPQHLVVSEAEPIDAVVRWAAGPSVHRNAAIAALRAVVAALGRIRSGEERRYFLKLDTAHILDLPLFCAAFPDVPWLFLYREPSEVMVSHARMPGLYFATAPGTGVESLEDRRARALARLLDAAWTHRSLGRGMLIDYGDLPELLESVIPAHFGFVPDADERRAMIAATAQDAKSPGQRFAEDASAKRAAATPRIASAVAAHLREPYERLRSVGGDAKSY